MERLGHVPLFARYFLGGINSVRGFADRSLGPRESSCAENVNDQTTSCGTEVIGGDKSAVLNTELLFPILRGVRASRRRFLRYRKRL